MTARFAGSRSLDERRRRWLATNEAERAPASRIEKAAAFPQNESAPKEVSLRQFPVRKVISPKAWKIALAGLLACLLGVLILAAGTMNTPGPQVLGPGWNRLFDGDGGRLAKLYEAGLLMLSGHLAFLIWWGRSQSLRDFDGQYRIWLCAAFATMFAGWSLAGDWHWALSDTLCWLWSARFPQREVVCWMLPLAIIAGILWRKLCADMRECKASYFLFAFAGPCFLAALVFRLGIDRTGWPESAKLLAGASLKMLASVAVFVSFLVHARYVLHISPEPPEHRPSLWARLLQAGNVLVQKLPRPRLAIWFKRRPKPADGKSAKKPKRSAKEKTPTIAEPAAEKPPARAIAAKTAPPKFAKPQEPAASTKAEPRPEAKPEPKPEPKPKPAEAAPQAKVAPAKAEPKQNAANAQPSAKKSAPEPNPPSPARPAAAQPEASKTDSSVDEPRQLRADPPLDSEMLKGLSKKERRKLRKQHRDAQRNG